MPKTRWDKIRDFIGAILFALVVAIVIRQMWFEFYTIPTGSMRPTLKEEDYLVVSKTAYGLNVPLQTAHFTFDPALVQRGDVVVFTGQNMDISDSDTTYFYLFPGKKQFVKRLIGKPGDTLYFYGGEIYGVNAQGEDLKDLREPIWFKNNEHIPFIRFEGKVDTPHSPVGGVYSPAIFYQMNHPVAKLNANLYGLISGEMIASSQKSTPLKYYSDLWGFKNFAMARLLNQSQLEELHPHLFKDIEPGLLYLELNHHPSLQGASLYRDELGRVRPELAFHSSVISLQNEHLLNIAEHLTTCRFVVKNGSAFRLGWNPKDLSPHLPQLPHVPDGTYELQNGKAYEISWGGIAKELPASHPLYPKSKDQIQLLYNLGIEFLNQYNPTQKFRHLYPSRYAYFRNNELYLLGSPIIKKDDPALTLHFKREYSKQSLSTSINPYYPFDDSGPPLTKEGKIDIDFIRKYGITVPEKMYLMLGDNHAMSGDSRQFGFVPEDNLKGNVKFLFWPPGPRWGTLSQPSTSYFTFPNLFAWSSAIFIAIGCSMYTKRRLKQPMKF